MFEKTVYENYDVQEEIVDDYAEETVWEETAFVQSDPVDKPQKTGLLQNIVKVLVLAAAGFAGFWTVNMLGYSIAILQALEHIDEAVAVPAWALLTSAALLLCLSCVYQLLKWKKPVQYPVVRQQMNDTRILLLLGLLLAFFTVNIIQIAMAAVLFAVLYLLTIPVKAMAVGMETK